MPMAQSFYAHGKLLLTGEYVVLDGALALGLPTRLGQHLDVHLDPAADLLHWQSLQPDGSCWLEVTLRVDDLLVVNSSDAAAARRLQEVLREARRLAGDRFLFSGGQVRTRLEFDRHWGLGSSSTLLAMVAEWAKIDMYQLAAATFGGSGYDLACARANGAVLYQKRGQQGYALHLPFHPPFSDQLYLVYSGSKQNSREGIRHYREQKQPPPVEAISTLTLELAHTTSFTRFCTLIEQHEALISRAVGMPPVGKNRFAQAPGIVKSLGAWGGDFLLCASAAPAREVHAYFENKGISTIFSYKDLIQC